MCPWKGTARYYDVDDDENAAAAWHYPRDSDPRGVLGRLADRLR